MKTIKFFLLTTLLVTFSNFLTPPQSLASSFHSQQSVSTSNSNYIEYVFIDGVRYKYTYSDDGKLISIEAEE